MTKEQELNIKLRQNKSAIDLNTTNITNNNNRPIVACELSKTKFELDDSFNTNSREESQEDDEQSQLPQQQEQQQQQQQQQQPGKKKWNPFKSKSKAHKNDFTRIFQTASTSNLTKLTTSPTAVDITNTSNSSSSSNKKQQQQQQLTSQKSISSNNLTIATNKDENNLHSYKCCHIRANENDSGEQGNNSNNNNNINGRIYVTRNCVCFYGKLLNEELNLTINFTDIDSIRKERKLKGGNPIESSITLATNTQRLYEFANFKSIEKVYKLLEKRLKSKNKQSLMIATKTTSSSSNSKTTTPLATTATATNPLDSIKSSANVLAQMLDSNTSNSLNENDKKNEEDDDDEEDGGDEEEDDDDEDQQEAAIQITEPAILSQQQQQQQQQQQDNKSDNSSILVDADDEDEMEKAKILTMNAQFNELSKEMINCEFNTSIDRLVYILFESKDFFESFWKARKFYEINVSPWSMQNGFCSRTLQYCINGMIGSICCRTQAQEKMLKYDLNNNGGGGQVIAEAESTNYGIPYADAFTVLSRFCIDKLSENRTRLVVRSWVNWLYKPNFIMKAFIDKNCNTAMADSFKALTKRINDEIIDMKDKPLPLSTIAAIALHSTPSTTTLLTKIKKPTIRKRRKNGAEAATITESNMQPIFELSSETTTNSIEQQQQKNINADDIDLKMAKSHSISASTSSTTTTTLNTIQNYFEINNIKELFRFLILLLILMVILNGYLINRFNNLENNLNSCKSQCPQTSQCPAASSSATANNS